MTRNSDTTSSKHPKLRFPGFSSSWVEEKLSYFIYALDAGVSVNSEDRPATINEKGVLKTSCVSSGKFRSQENKVVIKENEISRLRVPVSQETIIISRMNTPQLVGANAYIYKDSPNLFLPDRLWAAKVREEKSAQYLGQYLSSKKGRHDLASRATGTSGSMKNISKNDVLSIKFAVPEYSEQQKIASFLSAVDSWLDNLRSQKSSLETYKKSIMQKIFSQEIRLKDKNGNYYQDWEEYELGEVFYSEKGSGLSKELLNPEGINECILYGELYTRYKEVITKVESKTNIEEGLKSKPNDLLIPCSTTTSGIDLANVTALNKSGVLLGGDITVMRSKLKTNNIFFAYYLSNFKKKAIAKYAQGSTIIHLYYNHFKKILIDLPSLNEQEHITDYMISIDKIIESVDLKIVLTTKWKKALIQRMFV